MIIDQEARDRATFSNENTSVEAGAGTGKTSLLCQRYIEILKSNIFSPSEVVAITFTEASAAELRERIASELEKNPLAHVTVSDILFAPISTIHSFASGLLKSFPFQAKVNPQFRLLKNLSLDLFLSETFDSWFENAFPSNTLLFETLFGLGFKTDKIKQLFVEIYHERDLFFPENIPLEPRSSREFLMAMHLQMKELYNDAQSNCIQKDDAGFMACSQIQQQMDQLLFVPDDLLLRSTMDQIHMPKAKGNQANWKDKEACKDFKAKWDKMALELDEWKICQRRFYFVRLLHLTTDLLAYTEKSKFEAEVLDFQDLLIKSRDLVVQHPSIRAEISKTFKFFFVDEFQDTDPIQAELIWALCSIDGQLKNNSLFIVGDPKQSIYRFRRASIETYRKLTTTFKELDQHIVISQNFRTRKNLIEWINQAFSTILKSDYIDLQTPVADSEKVRAYRLKDPEGTSDSSGIARQKECSAICNWILSEHQSGRPFHEMAILYPTRTGLDQLESTLRTFHIPFSVLGGSSFFERSEVRDLILTLESILFPHRLLATVSALKSGFLAVCDSELFALKTKVGLDFRNNPSQHKCFEILNACHANASSRRLSDTLLLFLQQSWAMAQLKLRPHADQAIGNVYKLVHLIQDYESEISLSSYQCLDWLKMKMQVSENEEEAHVSVQEGVSLMTIHQSKGLEFPVVILSQLSSSASIKGETVIVNRATQTLEIGLGDQEHRFSTSHYESMLDGLKNENLEERKRLLYVACTRAKEKLILCSFPYKSERKDSYEFLLKSGIEAAKEYTIELSANLSAPLSNPRNQGIFDPIPKDPQEDELYRHFLNEFSQRSSLFSFPYTLVHPSEYAEKFSSQDFELSTHKSSIGSAFHRVFEHKPWLNSVDLPYLCKWISHEQNISSREAELFQVCQKTLSHPIWDQIRIADEIYCEMPFSWIEEESMLQGVMDLVYRIGDKWHVIDYKTNQFNASLQSSLEMQYKAQIKTYSKALSKMVHTQSVLAYLFFVRGPELILISS